MEINNGNGSKTKQQYFLTAEALLKYLLGTSERVSTMIMCKTPDTDLVTTDYDLYEAFGSVKTYDNVTRARIVKLLENVDVLSYRKEKGEEKKILTHERVEELRKIALKDLGDDKNG